MVRCPDAPLASWLPLPPLAADVHEEALTLTPSSDGLLKVALTKDVPRGAALLIRRSASKALTELRT